MSCVDGLYETKYLINRLKLISTFEKFADFTILFDFLKKIICSLKEWLQLVGKLIRFLVQMGHLKINKATTICFNRFDKTEFQFD